MWLNAGPYACGTWCSLQGRYSPIMAWHGMGDGCTAAQGSRKARHQACSACGRERQEQRAVRQGPQRAALNAGVDDECYGQVHNRTSTYHAGTSFIQQQQTACIVGSVCTCASGRVRVCEARGAGLAHQPLVNTKTVSPICLGGGGVPRETPLLE